MLAANENDTFVFLFYNDGDDSLGDNTAPVDDGDNSLGDAPVDDGDNSLGDAPVNDGRTRALAGIYSRYENSNFTVPYPQIIHTSNVDRPGLWVFKLDRHIIGGESSN